MAVTMTEALAQSKNSGETLTEVQHRLRTGNETMSETTHRLQDEIDNPAAPVVPATTTQPNPQDDDTNDGTDVKTVVDDSWTVAELKNYAVEQGIDVSGLTKKSDLIAAING